MPLRSNCGVDEDEDNDNDDDNDEDDDDLTQQPTLWTMETTTTLEDQTTTDPTRIDWKTTIRTTMDQTT